MGKRTIVGYPILGIFHIVLSFVFIGMTFVLYDTNDIVFPVFISFFTICSLGLLFKVFYGKRYISKNSLEAQQISDKNLDEFLSSYGNFKFDDYGFTIISLDNEDYIAWDEIQKMIAFKIDLLAYDEIRLQIQLENGTSFEIGEEIPGWFQFLVRSKEQFPEIDPLWEVGISSPAFERKETLIYSKQKHKL